MRSRAALLLCLGGLPLLAQPAAPPRPASAPVVAVSPASAPVVAVSPASAPVVAASPAAAPAASPAPDAANGRLLYSKGPRGGGAPACASCHGASPVTNAYGIRIAGDNPAELGHAFASVVAMRSFQFATRFTPKEIADLAAFIGDPAPKKPGAK